MIMTGNEYQKLAARTINKDLARWEQEDHALHGMVGEIGEIHSMYQKGFQGHAYPAEHYKKELGDLLWFVAEYCTAKGWELDEIMQMNIDKLRARFPQGFEVDKSLHRKEGDV
jgi:NTP pyrophosphatase (non-canonical NTP hydrolase)